DLTWRKLLTWNSHIRIKRLSLNKRLSRPRTLLINNKHTELKVKVFMFKTLLYLYGYMVSNYGNISLRKITNAPPIVSNYTSHIDLSIKTVTKEATYFYKKSSHPSKNTLKPTH
ncbi:Uncharacterized protein FWK35_00023927, partial [Aphis craccivora]